MTSWDRIKRDMAAWADRTLPLRWMVYLILLVLAVALYEAWRVLW